MNEYANYQGDPVRFERDWLPKIKAYQKNLDDSIIREYLASEEQLVKSPEGYLDATKVPERVLSEKELSITNSNATTLVDKIAAGELTSEETFTAFVKRAMIAHQLTNCAMMFFVDEGLARAKELDAYFAKTGKTVGPLHGLPISFKEQIGFKDKVTTASYVSYLDFVTKEDAVTVQVMRNAGGVFYVRTAEPQCMMSSDAVQHITGRSYLPQNTNLNPGGSTSGEGALVAMGGSPMGVGTDSGGSIRTPSAYCGLWGFKPTSKRTSVRGIISASGNGPETIPCSMGPLTRSADDVDLFMRAYAGQEPWKLDVLIPPIPWKVVEEPLPESLTIAIYYDDGVCRPHPPIERGLKVAACKLKEAGVTVVEWKPHRVAEAMGVARKGFTADGNFKQKRALAASGEPIVEMVKLSFNSPDGDKGISVHENHEINELRNEIIYEYQDIMDREKIDFILGPTASGVSTRPGTSKHGGYAMLWNVMDFPGLVFPTGLVHDPKIDLKQEFEARNPLEERDHGLYQPEYFLNAPIGLQLVGRRFDDERLVKAGKVLHEIITGC